MHISVLQTLQKYVVLLKFIFCDLCRFTKIFAAKVWASMSLCLIREKVVTFRMVKLNLLLSIFLITK
jgi:hypothetical protein